MVPLSKKMIRVERTITLVSINEVETYHETNSLNETRQLTPDEALELEYELDTGDKLQSFAELLSDVDFDVPETGVIAGSLTGKLSEVVEILDVKEDGTYTVDRAARY